MYSLSELTFLTGNRNNREAKVTKDNRWEIQGKSSDSLMPFTIRGSSLMRHSEVRYPKGVQQWGTISVIFRSTSSMTIANLSLCMTNYIEYDGGVLLHIFREKFVAHHRNQGLLFLGATPCFLNTQ